MLKIVYNRGHVFGFGLLLTLHFITTGELTVNNKMDRELLPWINFTVKATDNGIPPLSGYSNISIQVLDENDNNPVFTEETLIFHVHENATVGTKVRLL